MIRNVYRYPFEKGVKIKEVQPTGEYAHTNWIESKYAVDFPAPTGTWVVAARGGTVWFVKDDSDKWGLDPKLANEANFVAIDHEDGTYAEYIHLGKDTVLVKQGDKVMAGQKLGRVGLSGCMSEPHLHFNVFVYDKEKKKGESIPFEFDSSN